MKDDQKPTPKIGDAFKLLRMGDTLKPFGSVFKSLEIGGAFVHWQAKPPEKNEAIEKVFEHFQAESDRRRRYEESQVELVELLKRPAATIAEPEAESRDDRCDLVKRLPDDGQQVSERELSNWLRETWNNENRPGGTLFFTKLKKYSNKKGSPITAHYSAGKEAGFSWRTSKGSTGEMKKSTLLNKVSLFKKTP
ncbi:MAG: hypothetical protein PHG00_09400 [Methylococcales bacterium]|nr:hypothetical protein [Methylococcales bacterium]